MVYYYLFFILLIFVLVISYSILLFKVENVLATKGISRIKKILSQLVLIFFIILSIIIVIGYTYFSNTLINKKMMSTINSYYEDVNITEHNMFSLKGSFESKGIDYVYEFNPKDSSLFVSDISTKKYSLN